MNRKSQITTGVLVTVAAIELFVWWRLSAEESAVETSSSFAVEHSALREAPRHSGEVLAARSVAAAPSRTAALGTPTQAAATSEVDLGQLAAPVSVGHVPYDIQSTILSKIASALLLKRTFVVMTGSADCFLGAGAPEKGTITATYDGPTLKITFSSGQHVKTEAYGNLSADMIRTSRSFDDLISKGAALGGDVSEVQRDQEEATRFVNANGYPILAGWAPCPPTSEEAIEVVYANPTVELTTNGFTQAPGRAFRDNNGGLITWEQSSGVYLVHYHKRSS